MSEGRAIVAATTETGAATQPSGEGLAALDARRAAALAAFAAAPIAHVTGWRIATALRAARAELWLDDQDRVVPSGFGTIPDALRDHARAFADALCAWLSLERTAGSCAPAARSSDGAKPTPLRDGRDYCAVCGPPVSGTVSLWWTLPDTGWRCDACDPFSQKR